MMTFIENSGTRERLAELICLEDLGVRFAVVEHGIAGGAESSFGERSDDLEIKFAVVERGIVGGAEVAAAALSVGGADPTTPAQNCRARLKNGMWPGAAWLA